MNPAGHFRRRKSKNGFAHIINASFLNLSHNINLDFALGCILVIMYFAALLTNDPASASIQEARNQIGSFLQQLSPAIGGFALRIWSFLSPILSLVIIIVILRWLLVSPRFGLGEKLGVLVNDVPSLISIVVLINICVLPIIGTDVPQALTSIALVIVGFYFGSERKAGLATQKEVEGINKQHDDRSK